MPKIEINVKIGGISRDIEQRGTRFAVSLPGGERESIFGDWHTAVRETMYACVTYEMTNASRQYDQAVAMLKRCHDIEKLILD